MPAELGRNIALLKWFHSLLSGRKSATAPPLIQFCCEARWKRAVAYCYSLGLIHRFTKLRVNVSLCAGWSLMNMLNSRVPMPAGRQWGHILRRVNPHLLLRSERHQLGSFNLLITELEETSRVA